MTLHLTADLTRESAVRRDEASPLAGRRELFQLPQDVIYLDGNSLGALPHAVPERLSATLTQEWGHGLIASWNTAGWMDLPAVVAAKLGPILGVDAVDLHVGDSTSVSLFKAMVAACRLRPERRVIVCEPSPFPTNGYVARAVADLLGMELRQVDPTHPTSWSSALDADVAVVSLNHVDFRSGARLDLVPVTEAVHEAGAVVLWDLCHSAGAMALGLREADVDLAVGCTYKYLNGGPGAPAFTYAAPALQPALAQPIPGWIGHARPFAMEPAYAPADGVGRMASGTPPVLGLAALDAALEVFAGVDLGDVERASSSLTTFFIDLVDARLGGRVEVVTPRDPARRGSHVSLRHPQAYGVVQALIERGVVADFRTPDLARFGFAPLYVRHVDVYDAVEHLRAVLDDEEFARPAYATRAAVT